MTLAVGVDIGRSQVKVAWGAGPEGPVRTRAFVPILRAGWLERVAGAEVPEALRLRVGDELYEVAPGEGSAVEQSPRKRGRLTALLLLAGVGRAMAEAGAREAWAVTGLPAAFATADAEVLKQEVRAALEAGVECWVGARAVRLSREAVRVAFVAEGDGILADFLSGGPARPGPVLVLDFGHATTNLVVYEGYARQRVRTLPVGGLRVYRRFLDEYLVPRWGPFDRDVEQQIMYGLADRGRIPHVALFEGPPPEEEVRSVLGRYAAEVWRTELRPQVVDSLSGQVYVEHVVGAGGGVHLFPVREDYPGAYVPAEPRFAQVRGYMHLAWRVFASREGGR